VKLFKPEKNRKNIEQFSHSIPEFDHPIRFMDIGCGDGALTCRLLAHLMESKKVPEIGEVLLIDPSPAMISMATEKVRSAFPDVIISTDNARIQDCSLSFDRHYDIAMSSLAYHH